ncbi:MAG: DAK2 domain-containing protein [Lachnospiraceae bacterium]|nr:DAK2 domain-containing protein [Lachnospiraceae bacterium]
MFLAGAKRLEAKKEWINELNVFPVPDGDTGTNMTLTIMAAAKEVSALENPTMSQVCKAVSFGSLRGARGNSGVILSQLLRGLTKGIGDHEEIDMKRFVKAFRKAVESAYKAVMKPKEGTILTVAKAAYEKAEEMYGETDDLKVFFGEIIQHADKVLAKTPDMLPVLKQAGVVDSGGQGLVEVLKGAYDAFLGKEVDLTVETSGSRPAVSSSELTEDIPSGEITFGYCTEFIVMLEKGFDKSDEQKFKSYLESLGDSIVLVADEGLVKVHVHTNDPGLAIQKGLSYGSLTSMKIDNMREEHNERLKLQEEKKAKLAPAAERKPIGFVAVSIGEGMNEIFKGLGVDYIIEGGQTMNPSTEDMLNAIENVNADAVFILPNNKNIILAANQACDLVEDKEIIVIPTKTVPQGITAVISYIPEKSARENEARMLEDIKSVKTGQVTYAVRDTSIDGKEIKQDDIMGIGDAGILSVGTSIKDTTLEMIDQMADEDTELISIYYGSDVEEEDVNALTEAIEKKHMSCDVDVQYGGQPIYYYIVSVE